MISFSFYKTICYSAFCENELLYAFLSAREDTDNHLSDYYLEAIKELHAIIGTEAETSIFEKTQKIGIVCSEPISIDLGEKCADGELPF